MAPFDNDDSGWLNTAWTEYTDSDAPWLKISKTARAILIAPLLAVFVAFADLIETWATELLINPLVGVGEFGADLIATVFFGALGRYENPAAAFFEAGDPLTGMVQAIWQSWLGVAELIDGFGLSALPFAIIVVLPLAYLLGRVINRG
jgi:hypothetical protein